MYILNGKPKIYLCSKYTVFDHVQACVCVCVRVHVSVQMCGEILKTRLTVKKYVYVEFCNVYLNSC
jgi:hypothetical protein